MTEKLGILSRFKKMCKSISTSDITEVVSPGSNGEKKLQENFKTTEQALKFYNKQMLTHLAPLMKDFIAEQGMMFISTSDAHGECDSSFRAGEPGFVVYLNKNHIIYPEFKGNGVMASMGNISENPNIGLLFLDFFKTKVGLHVNGKAKIIPKNELKEALSKINGGYEKVSENKQNFKAVSYILIEVEEAFIHCSVHIPMLKKIDVKSVPTARVKEKGGDAFDVGNIPREWVK